MPRLDNDTDRTVFIAPTGGVVAGSLYLIGAALVFATETVAQTLPFVGVFRDHVIRDAPVLGTDVVAVGAALYWDNTNFRLTTTVSTNKLVGHAMIAKANGPTVIDYIQTEHPSV